jgi:CBS domain-containing protein
MSTPPNPAPAGRAKAGPGTASSAASLIEGLANELAAHVPFSHMAAAHVQQFVAAARQTYYAPGEVLLQPRDGPVHRLLCVRRGSVSGRNGLAEGAAADFHFEAGDLFPVGAVFGERPVTAIYEAVEDTFCLEVDAEVVRRLSALSPPWADFLGRRLQRLLEISERALRAVQSSQTLAETSLEAPLSSLPRKAPLACSPATPLRQALELMQKKRVGSILVLAEDRSALGILTRHDVLDRVALGRPPHDATIADVMTAPVRTLDIESSVQEAALVMSGQGIRHLPLTEGGKVVSVVSERDLFALQRLSLHHVGGAIRACTDPAALPAASAGIRRFARQLVSHGVSARSLTRIVSHLNDLLVERLVTLVAEHQGLDLSRACWLGFGSEGRLEQTIATDQDNGIVFEAGPDLQADRDRWLALADEVNCGLDACGYPLCKGNVMARNPACCLSVDEWCAKFDDWIERGAPEDLLNASIYFDLRALAGQEALAAPLRERVTTQASRWPRFLRQLAENALRHGPSLNWRGALDPTTDDSGEWIDLKLGGTAVFVDAARIFALAQGVAVTGTRARLEAVAPAMKVPDDEAASWVHAFELLQTLRLRVQMERPDDRLENANRVDPRQLDPIDRRMLKEALHVARALQQRLELDYLR